MAWRNDVRDRTREWVRPARGVPLRVYAPLWLRQSIVGLFIFFLVLGASRAPSGLAVDVAAFARDAVEKDLRFEDVKAWAQKVPSGLKQLLSFDIKGFWSQAVSGKPVELAWPASGTITSYFGWRPNPNGVGMSLHQGIDIDVPKGSKVVSVLDGVVADIRTSPEYGLVVEVAHAGGLSTVYGHLDSAAVARDQRVRKGDVLGTVGDSGNATAPHLHFELRKDGLEIDPLTVLPPLIKGS